jgi:hypothetical protein
VFWNYLKRAIAKGADFAFRPMNWKTDLQRRPALGAGQTACIPVRVLLTMDFERNQQA